MHWCIKKLSLAIVHTQFLNGNSTYEINDYFIQKILVTIVDQKLQQCIQKVIIAIMHNLNGPYAFKCCPFPQFSALVVNCKMHMHRAYQIYQFYWKKLFTDSVSVNKKYLTDSICE